MHFFSVFPGPYLKVIIIAHLHTQLGFEPSIDFGVGFAVKYLVFFCKSNKTTAVALILEQDAETGIVTETPKHKDRNKKGLLDPAWQEQEQCDLNAHGSQSQVIKCALLFSRIKKG